MTTPIERVLERLQGVKRSGDTGRQYMAICPAHADREQSLAVGVKEDGKVLLHCYVGCRPADICAAIGLDISDLFDDQLRTLTLEELAHYKRLPVDFLTTRFNLKTGPGPGNSTYVGIPYRDENMQVLFARSRWKLYGAKHTLQDKGVRLAPYNLWNLPDARQAKTLTLVEGESNVWALVFHNIPCLGIPGANATKTLQAAHVAGIDTVNVWCDPGPSGVAFANGVVKRLQSFGFAGAVRLLSHPTIKDPSDLHRQHPTDEEFAVAWAALTDRGAAPARPSDHLPAAVADHLTSRQGEKDYPAGRFPFTDVGNRMRMIHRHGEDLRFCKVWDRWYIWDGTHWRPDMDGEAARRAEDAVLAINTEARNTIAPDGADQATRLLFQRRRAECEKWAEASQSAGRLAALQSLASTSAEVAITADRTDRHHYLLNCPNGTLDLTTGRLRDHNRADLITRICPTHYDPDAASPAWDRFLASTFPTNPENANSPADEELIAFMRRLCGLCMTGVISEHILPVFWGNGANGKSTLVGTLLNMLGEGYAGKAPDGLLEIKYDRHPVDVATMHGRRLVWVSETREGRRLDEALVKSLTGGEKLSARRLYENPWEFTPTHKLILCTNHDPKIDGTDDGIWRRILKVPFLVRFWKNGERPRPGEERHPDRRQDENLPAKLAAEMPGILRWCVQGCMEWLKDGLCPPERVQRATDDYRAVSDVTSEFVSDNFIFTGRDVDLISVAQVYSRYESWCRDEGIEPRSKKWLSQYLLRLNPPWQQSSTRLVRSWVGIAERSSSPARHKPEGSRTDLSDFD